MDALIIILTIVILVVALIHGRNAGYKAGFAVAKRLYEYHPEWLENPPKFEVSIEANLIDPKTGQTHVVKFP